MSLLKKIRELAGAGASKPVVARAPRVSLTPLHRICFVDGKDGIKSTLVNLSTSGMALLGGHAQWQPGQCRGGLLGIDGEEFSIEAKIRHRSGQLAGCEFVGGENGALKRAIEVYLRVEILALTLRQVNEAYMKPDPRGRTLWYTDGRQNELFVVVDDHGVVAFHMTFLGNYIEGGRGSPARMGELREAEGHFGQKGSTLVDLTGRPMGQTRNLALAFLRNVDQLPGPIREELARSFAPATSAAGA